MMSFSDHNTGGTDIDHSEKIARACRMIEAAGAPLKLEELAKSVGMSQYHFHRIFSKITGMTPKAYASAERAERVRERLTGNGSVTEAIYDAGYQSSGRFYEVSKELLGMSPGAFKAGGAGEEIRFAVGESSLGSILVAASAKGVCAIFMGDDPDFLARELQDRFPKAELRGGDGEFEQWVAQVVAVVEAPQTGLELPLDLRGTAFQHRVWSALREIPPGTTMSYTEVAQKIGLPKAVRAVAQACGANKLAVVIPCHRVVRTDGGISGYRWGVERKRVLLHREGGSPRPQGL